MRSRVILAIKIAAVFGLFWIAAWHTLDPDFGWHLTSGNYIRAHGVPAHDIYTYTARDFPWINHEWGNDVIVSILYGLGGYLLLSIFYSSIWTAAIFLGGNRKTSLLVLLLAVLALIDYSGIRPVTWTVFGLALLLRIVNSKNKKIMYVIPLLFVIWANLHAGFISGLAVLAYYAISRRSRFLAGILLASFLATFINPYGIRLYEEIFRTLFDSQLHHQINEWFPVDMSIFSWTYAILWGAGFLLFTRKKFRDWFGLNSFFLVSTLSANRNVPLFVVASIKDLESYRLQAKKTIPKKLDWPKKIIIMFFVAVIAGAELWGLYHHRNVIMNQREAFYPSAAVTYLDSHPCVGNLFSDYDYGGYLIWKLPQQPVYIDGRMPSWRNDQGQKYINIYFDVLAKKSVQQKEFKKYNVQCALLKAKTDDLKIINRLEKAKWRLMLQDNDSYLLLSPKNKI